MKKAADKLPKDPQGHYKATFFKSALEEFGKFQKKPDAVLQILAAELVDVDLKLWGYTDGEADNAYNNIYKKVDLSTASPTTSTVLDRVKAAKPKHP